MIIFSGNSNKPLASKIAQELGLELGDACVKRFADGEVNVQINQNVRGCNVFIIQSTSYPTNDNLMELVIMADALRRSSAASITAIVPYYGYSRQDRRVRSARVPISAKLVADIICCSGVDRMLTIDLHSEQIQGFFDIPVDNIYASTLIAEDLKKTDLKDLMIVSPDIGGVQRARAIAKKLNGELAVIDKRRLAPNHSEVMHIIGNVENKSCIIIDDIVDTGGTLIKAAESLKERKAKSVKAYITHAVLSKDASTRINNSAIDELVVTDTILLPEGNFNSIRQINTASLLAECIRRVESNGSISEIMQV